MEDLDNLIYKAVNKNDINAILDFIKFGITFDVDSILYAARKNNILIFIYMINSPDCIRYMCYEDHEKLLEGILSLENKDTIFELLNIYRISTKNITNSHKINIATPSKKRRIKVYKKSNKKMKCQNLTKIALEFM